MKLKDRIRKSLYGFFRNEINEFIGVTNEKPLPIEVHHVGLDGVRIFRKEVLVPDYRQIYHYDKQGGEAGIGRAIEDIKKELFDDIVNAGLIKVDSAELFSPKHFQAKKIVASIAVANLNANS